MAQATRPLAEVDEVKITLVMDNSIDLSMANTEITRRFPLGPNPFKHHQPIAEHGFSALIRIKQGNKDGTVLFDTGASRSGFLNNLDALEINLAEVQAIVLSHGHADHAMGLFGLIDRLGAQKLPLVLHPDAFLERKVILPDGSEINAPAPQKADLLRENMEVVEETDASMLIDGMLLISGEVGRATDFERGFPAHYAKRRGAWEPDPLVMDDQCAIINVRGKGLVIVTGCSHAGIINIIRHAQFLTGVQTICAVIGGFHLTGGLFEPIIPITTAILQKINPRYVMPCHCTGWSATHQIARLMPEAFIQSSVGTTLVL